VRILLSMGESQGYMEAYEKIITFEPEKVNDWLNKAWILWTWGEYKKSLESYEKALEIEPNNTDAWIRKGDFLSYLGIYNNALKIYDKIIAISPKNTHVWISKGITLYNVKKYTKCLNVLEQAFDLDPKNTKICNLLAEYYLMFGDTVNASKYAENALLIDKNNAASLYIKGKIKIEEQDYTTSINYFKKAISFNLKNPRYRLWNSYAKYLMAESELASDEKKYQDTILAIIRELEKVDICNFPEYKTNVKIIPCSFKNLVIYLLKLTKRAIIHVDIDEKLTVKLLEIINPLLTKFENPIIIGYNYYFLGCFYYKINDYFTAIDYLSKCKNLTSDSKMEKLASETLDNIWNNKIRPSIWKWWLYSPVNCWTRRIPFVILVSSLVGILLPSIASKIINYSSIHLSNLFVYIPFAYFPTIESIILTIVSYLNSFFSTIDWNKNTTPLTFLTLIILFILLSPNIQHFKGSQFEIEVRPPLVFELSPSLIEKKLNDLEYTLRR